MNAKRKIALGAVLLTAIGVAVFYPPCAEVAGRVLSAFASGDFTVMRAFVAQYGPMAAAVSFALMVFQSVAAPLPAFLITFANASLFGWRWGALLSWTSAMAGAALCFYIARILGRDVVERLITKAGLRSVDDFFMRHGKQSVLIARLLPFVSFDFVSYAAGLTSIGFRGFFVATGIGQLPATIVYSYVGGMLTGGARGLVTGLLILFALSALIVLMRKIYTERRSRGAFG